MRRRIRNQNRFWRWFLVLMVCIAIAALVLWWRDGAWTNGALPTHGMQSAVGGALVAVILVFLKLRFTGRRR